MKRLEKALHIIDTRLANRRYRYASPKAVREDLDEVRENINSYLVEQRCKEGEEKEESTTANSGRKGAKDGE